MEPTTMATINIVIAFTSIMFFGYRYADGKWNVSESKKSSYRNWTKEHGKTIKRGIIILSCLFGIGVLFFLQGTGS